MDENAHFYGLGLFVASRFSVLYLVDRDNGAEKETRLLKEPEGKTAREPFAVIKKDRDTMIHKVSWRFRFNGVVVFIGDVPRFVVYRSSVRVYPRWNAICC